MTSGSNNSKRSTERLLARSLGALFAVTGSLMLSSAGAADAAVAHSDATKANGTEPLEIRVQKVQQQLGQNAGTEVNQGDPYSPHVQPMWWGNWHNWHRHNWGNGARRNGGWHNWHNWHNW